MLRVRDRRASVNQNIKQLFFNLNFFDARHRRDGEKADRLKSIFIISLIFLGIISQIFPFPQAIDKQMYKFPEITEIYGLLTELIISVECANALSILGRIFSLPTSPTMSDLSSCPRR